MGGGLMAETKPIQIFLCHASEDKIAVMAIYDRLKGLGYQPWLDQHELLPGQRWRVEIPKAIRASDYILIFLSKTSVAKRGYVQAEFKLTLNSSF
jgi:TIR domain